MSGRVLPMASGGGGRAAGSARGWRRWVPFGLLVPNKPRHYREMLRALWQNRDRFSYALRILRHGVCDGCSLGPRGLYDDAMDGIHLCTTRLALLRLNTMPEIRPHLLADIGALRRLSNAELHRLGRVPYPLVRARGERGFRRLGWAEAVAKVAAALQQAVPDRAAFFVSSRGLTNEAYYLVQKLARLAGTPHIDSCARLCHAASAVGLAQAIGYGAPTVSLRDMIETELLVLFGTDLVNNQPVTAKYMALARRRGARIVVVNPFREPGLERYWVPSMLRSALFGTPLMDEHFPVKPGGDIAFISGALKALIETGAIEREWIARHTTGFEELARSLAAMSWPELERSSGLAEADMRRFARLYAEARSAVLCWSMGLTQWRFGVDNVRAVVNLALARGMVGRPGAGLLPIRGHSGVQGTAECGADASKLPGALPITEGNARRFAEAWGGPIPARPGWSVPEAVDRAAQGEVDLLYLVGGNLLETMPDTANARAAHEAVRLRVHQDIVLNTSTLLDCEGEVLVLPAATRYEQPGGGTSTSTERRIRFSPEVRGPRVRGALPEWQIAARIGERLWRTRHGLGPQAPTPFSYRDVAQVRAEMGRLMPLYRGIERLRREGDAVQWGGPRLCAGGFPNLPEGRARFAVLRLPQLEPPPGKLFLVTRRGKQFNSMRLGARDPFTGAGRTTVIVAEEDRARLGLEEGAPVEVRSELGALRATLLVGPCRPGHLQAFWPEANVLLPRAYDPASHEPEYGVAVELRPL
ncbi:MAG: formate dehydrogenase [Planctomycetota bacterium]|nr:MAG: formate dehydrogenase [Planctomycetota bacterium]